MKFLAVWIAVLARVAVAISIEDRNTDSGDICSTCSKNHPNPITNVNGPCLGKGACLLIEDDPNHPFNCEIDPGYFTSKKICDDDNGHWCESCSNTGCPSTTITEARIKNGRTYMEVDTSELKNMYPDWPENPVLSVVKHSADLSTSDVRWDIKIWEDGHGRREPYSSAALGDWTVGDTIQLASCIPPGCNDYNGFDHPSKNGKCCASTCGEFCGAPNCQKGPGGSRACCKGSYDLKTCGMSGQMAPCILGCNDYNGFDHPSKNGKCCALACGEFCGAPNCQKGPGGSRACCSGSYDLKTCGMSGQMAPCILA